MLPPKQVALLFPTAFWGAQDLFGRVAPSKRERGRFFLYYSTAGISGGAVLVALVSGQASIDFEQVLCTGARLICCLEVDPTTLLRIIASLC